MKITKITFFKVPFDGEHENAIRIEKFQHPEDLYGEGLNMFYKGELISKMSSIFDNFDVNCDKIVSDNFTSLEIPMLLNWDKVREFNFCAVYTDKTYDSPSLGQYINCLYFYNINDITLLNQNSVIGQYLYKINMSFDSLQNNIFYIYYTDYNSNIMCENHNFTTLHRVEGSGLAVLNPLEKITVPEPPFKEIADNNFCENEEILWVQVWLKKSELQVAPSFGQYYVEGDFVFFPLGRLDDEGKIHHVIIKNYEKTATLSVGHLTLREALRGNNVNQVKLTTNVPFTYTKIDDVNYIVDEGQTFEYISFVSGDTLNRHFVVYSGNGGRKVIKIPEIYKIALNQCLPPKTEDKILTDLNEAFPEYPILNGCSECYYTIGGIPTKFQTPYKYSDCTLIVTPTPSGIIVNKKISDALNTYIDDGVSIETYENLSNFTITESQFDNFMRNQGNSYLTNLEFSREKINLSTERTERQFGIDLANVLYGGVGLATSKSVRGITANSGTLKGGIESAFMTEIDFEENILNARYIEESNQAKIADLKNQAPSISLQSVSPLLNSNKLTIIKYVYAYPHETEYVKSYLHYLQQFGYKINRNIDIQNNYNDGKYFTYIKTVNAFFPTIPNYNDRIKIQNIYNRGLRIWNVDDENTNKNAIKNFDTMINNPTFGTIEEFT